MRSIGFKECTAQSKEVYEAVVRAYCLFKIT